MRAAIRKGRPLALAGPLPSPVAVTWVVTIAAIATLTLVANRLPALAAVPPGLTLPASDWISEVMAALVELTQPFFRGVSWLLLQPMSLLQALLLWLPWSVVVVAFCLLGWASSGARLALFAALGSFLTVGLGYWTEAMNTLALVGVSVPLSVATGFALGVAGHALPGLRRPLEVLLDFMQTVPAFAYLIPILLLFGFGPVVGLIASAIYAAPPMIRNTMLGLREVPEAQIESGLMSGCTPFQLFRHVRLPGAMPQILVGLNQTTMQALSMVIIAAIIGGFDDIGWSVLSSLRKAQFGQSLLAGLVIVFLAILIDRITWGFARRARRRQYQANLRRTASRWLAAGGALGAAAIAAALFPVLGEAPASSLVAIAEPLNRSLEAFLQAYGPALAEIKQTTFFYVLLPLRIGLREAVTPFTWGFELTGPIVALYWTAVGIAFLWLVTRASAVAIAMLAFAWILWFGVTGVPWVAFSLLMVVIAYLLGGRPTALTAVIACGFIALTGLWELAMLSLYLCGAAVLISLLLGGVIGVIATHSPTVSAVNRVFADTLQTMPQFVLLIPFLMIFQVGEFTALLAIIAYAIVPAMRYVEQGLRGVDPVVVEAAEQLGCTRLQILLQVRFPMAAPVLALGVNQTIMFGLAMLAITALVGTQDLGQEVYVALSQADAGRGLLAGAGIATIALLSERLIRDWIHVLRTRRHVAAPALESSQPPV